MNVLKIVQQHQKLHSDRSVKSKRYFQTSRSNLTNICYSRAGKYSFSVYSKPQTQFLPTNFKFISTKFFFFFFYEIFRARFNSAILLWDAWNTEHDLSRGPKGIRGAFLSITLHRNIRHLKIKVLVRDKKCVTAWFRMRTFLWYFFIHKPIWCFKQMQLSLSFYNMQIIANARTLHVSLNVSFFA